MLERFTKPARTVVETATTYAKDARAGETRPEHLLRAVLADETCLASRVLAEVGAPPAELRTVLDRLRMQYVDGLDAEDAEALQAIGIDLDEVVRRIDDNLGFAAPSRRRPKFSRASKKVLELALREAVALRHNYIGTEHLLLGLVRQGDRVVLDSLASFDVDTSALRVAVGDAVRRTGEQTG